MGAMRLAGLEGMWTENWSRKWIDGIGVDNKRAGAIA